MPKKREARVDSPDLSTINAIAARCGLSPG